MGMDQILSSMNHIAMIVKMQLRVRDSAVRAQKEVGFLSIKGIITSNRKQAQVPDTKP